MNKQEYLDWMEDLERKSPSLGKWVSELSDATLNDWYENVFASIELRWAKAVNIEILQGDHDLTGFRRDQICATFIRRTQELSYRKQRQDDQPTHVPAMAILKGDPIMGPAFRDVTRQMDAHRLQHKTTSTPSDLVAEWTEAALQTRDKTPDDDDKQPRYRCINCYDSGFITIEVDGVWVAGCCKLCAKGTVRHESKWNSGRYLGYLAK